MNDVNTAFCNHITKEDLFNLYIIENKMCKEISIIYNVSKVTIKRALRFYNIKKSKDLKIEAHKRSMLNKYGVETYSQLPEFKEKCIQTHRKNCGEDWNFKTEEFKIKTKQILVNKYGVDNIMKLEECKTKIKNTKKRRYGDENYNNRDKAKETCLKLYSVDSYSKTKEYKEKIKSTNLKHCGKTSNLKTEEFKIKARQTCLEKYGVEYPLQNSEIITKVHLSKKRNHTICSSKFEDKVFSLLVKKYKKIKRNYKSEKYPFACDFYIHDINVYIEIQGYFSHGKNGKKILGPYNQNNQEHQKILKIWKAKNNKIYDDAINVWTVRDPLKRKIAKDNNINLLEFFTIEEFMSWYNEN